MRNTRSVVQVICITGALSMGCGVGADPAVDSDVNEAEVLAQQDQELIGQVGFVRDGFVAFDNPYGNGTANPAANIRGSAGFVHTGSGRSYVFLRVRDLPAGRTFGAHVHKLACADTKGGTHYQNIPSPTTPTDPAYANPTNEVWLDFTTHSEDETEGFAVTGDALKIVRADFRIRSGEAKAILVHTNPTASGGVAGAKLACIDVPF
jgi:hypothetical protein